MGTSKADAIRLALEQRVVLSGLVIARHERHPRLTHDDLGFGLRPHRAYCSGRRPDERQPGRRDGGREIFVLGEKSVTGMNRLGARGSGDVDDEIAA